jgi:hypothetical protein
MHTIPLLSKIYFGIILSIPIAFVVPFLLQNPNWSFPRTSTVFLLILLLRILNNRTAPVSRYDGGNSQLIFH